MFTVFYADSKNVNCISSGYCFEDDVENTIKEKISFLDKFIYLVNMYRILDDCFSDFDNFRVDQKRYFWKANKYLLNYVNAVYTFKEYSENCYTKFPDIREILDNYYKRMDWYAFLCNYRNRIIHQSNLIKDYDMKSGELFINLDELADAAKKQMATNKKGRENNQKFIQFIEMQYSIAKEIGQFHYLQAREVFALANAEIHKLSNEVFSKVYEAEVRACFEWFLSMTLQRNREYLDTYIVHDESLRNFHVNWYLEEYSIMTMFTLGTSFDITKSVIDFLKTNGYRYIYTRNNTLDEVILALED